MADYAHTITLGGEKFPVKMLAVRQLRTVTNKISQLLKELGPAMYAAETLSGDAPANGMDKMTKMLAIIDMSEEHFELLVDVLWLTLTRTHPDLTRDQFLDMPMTVLEMLMALPTVMMMTGLMEPSKPGEARPPETPVN